MTTPFAPEQAPEAGAEAPTSTGAPEGQPAGGEQSQAPAGADPRVLEQMQSQMQQFGGTLAQMAEYMPALQQIAGQQQPGEPALEDQFAQWFGMDPNGGYEQPGQAEPRYDPYTGEPVYQQGQQQPRFDPYTGEPLQPQAQAGPQFGDPNDLVNMFRQIVRDEVAPFQQERAQEQWNSLYEKIPAMKDPETAPQIAAQVADAAMLFSNGNQAEARKLANNPRFAEFAYFASVNQQRGMGETPAGAGDGPTPIETGSSTSVQNPAEGDPGDGIVNAGRASGGNAGSHFR